MSTEKLRDIVGHSKRQGYEYAIGLRAAEVEAALAEYDRLKAALEEIAEGHYACADGNCAAILTAREALKEGK